MDLKEGEKIAKEKEKAERKVEELGKKMEKTVAKKKQLGSTSNNESQLKRLEQLEKNLQTDLEHEKIEVAALEKQQKEMKKKAGKG